MASNIHTVIKCRNIAPLVNLKTEISSTSLKFAIFANNGSGKTFLSRLFRLLENEKSLLEDDKGIIITDSFLTDGTKNGEFAFRISNNESIKESIKIDINEGEKPEVPLTNYIYHTFNQDYVEKNIKELDYLKNANDEGIQGFILGKAHIDLSDEKKKLEQLEEEERTKKQSINDFIEQYKEEKLSRISNITRLNEYKELNFESIFKWDGTSGNKIDKAVEEYIDDYNKVKSVPENLNLVSEVSDLSFDFDRIISLQQILMTPYTLSGFSESFKDKIKSKQEFVEKGLEISKYNKVCPFCEREYDKDALDLIDLYTKYLNEQEAQTISLLKSYRYYFSNQIAVIKEKEREIGKQLRAFNEYKTKYIVSLEKEELELFDFENFIKNIEILISTIEEKKNNISNPQSISERLIESLKVAISTLSSIISSNNAKVKTINGKILSISEENKNVRKNICRAAFVFLYKSQKKEIEDIKQIDSEYKLLRKEITKKEETLRTHKKSEVAKTIKHVLDYFFSGEKYSLNEETFQLIFKQRILDKGNVKYVLSEGEKNIIAFAYYLGDAHVKINREEDYNKLFFIIDDPISSMDFSHVYTMSGVIRRLKHLFPKIEHVRYILLTHNNEFMRILTSNNIVDKQFLLQDGRITELNINYTVPYISHLLDIYKIARKGFPHSHTTPNSIRYIIETLVKFQNIELSKDGIRDYIHTNFDSDAKTFTFINDMSHGGWRSDDEPLLPDDYKKVCECLIDHIMNIFPNQIKFCEKNV